MGIPEVLREGRQDDVGAMSGCRVLECASAG
jgi:hypothetical protein